MAEKSIDLNKIYQYYVSQGVDPATAGQYTSYYALNAKQTMSIKNPSQLTWKPAKIIAPTYTKFKADKDPFVQSLIRTISTDNATIDEISSLVNSAEGLAYAKKRKLSGYGNIGQPTPGALNNIAETAFNEYQALKKQEGEFDFWAANSGLPSRKQKYKFSVNKSYNPYNEVEYPAARKEYTNAYKKYATDLSKIKTLTPEQAGAALAKFDTEFESYINKKLSSPNFFQTPFSDAAMGKTKVKK